MIISLQNLAKQILAEHAALKGLSGKQLHSCVVTVCRIRPLMPAIVCDAKCWFVKLWSSLELFGMEFLSCTNTDTKENGLIGVSKDRVSPPVCTRGTSCSLGTCEMWKDEEEENGCREEFEW